MLGLGGQKPRKFNYQPRFYDPEKEARELKKEIMSSDSTSKNNKYVPGNLIKQSRVKRMTYSEAEKTHNRGRLVVRLVIFMVLLLLAAYFILTFTGFEVLVKMFNKG